MSARTFLSIALWLAAPVCAQTSAVDPARLSHPEVEILRHRSRADRAAALDGLAAELTRLDATGDARDPRVAAQCEAHLLTLCGLAEDFGDPHKVRDKLRALAAGRLVRHHPAWRDALSVRLLLLDHQLGDRPARAARQAELGFIDAWWVLGPFDNERGAGYASEPAAARTFDPDRAWRGKKRDVRWRLLPAAPVRGFVDVGALLRPNEQVLALLATCLEADRAMDVVLHLGSSESFKVYLNGVALGGRDLRRRFEYDQDAVVLPLQAGPNRLVLQVGTREGPLGVAARLRTPAGAAVTGVRVRASRATMLGANATAPRTAAAPQLAGGARQGFAGAPATAPADAFRLALVLMHYHAADHDDTRILDLLEGAAAAMTDQPFVRYALATARYRADRGAAQSDENRRRHDFEAALAIDPDHIASMWQLANMELIDTGATGSAEQLLRRALKLRPDSPDLHLLHHDLLAKIGLDGLAAVALQRAAAGEDGAWLERAWRQLAGAHLRHRQVAQATKLLRALVARRARADDRLLLASTLLHAGDADAAIAELEAALLDDPYDRVPRLRLARLHDARGAADRALEQVRHWLTICPEDDQAWLELARVHGGQGAIERQREALLTAVELNPNLKSARRRLEALSAEQKPFYHPFVVDAGEVLGADRGPTAGASAANDPFEYLLDQRVVAAYRNGTTSEYRHMVVRILNPEGSKRFARFSVGFYRDEQRARLLAIAVHKKDGTTLRPRLRGSQAALPPLDPGDRVDLRYRIDDIAPSFFGDYFGLTHRFAHSQPCRRGELVVLLDPGREYGLQVAHGAPQPQKSVAGTRAAWRFSMQDVPGIDVEEHQPAPREFAPLVRISTYPSWNAFAAWWHSLIREQTQVSPAMRRKVEELTTGLTTDIARIRAIYRFVTTDIRYEAWEFGVHGYKPYATPVIFDRRHGDCKDKALLLNAMLSVVGIEAHPVLIHADEARTRDDLRLPMVEHFNHCISYVAPTATTPALFLDGTATWHPVGTLPEMDYGAEVLVVTGPQARLVPIPWPAPADNLAAEEIALKLDANGDADVRYVATPSGNRAVQLREFLANEPARQRENLELLLKQWFPGLEIVGHETSELADLSAPVRVDVRLRARRFAPQQGTALILPAAIGVGELSQLCLAETRRRPLLVGTPGGRRQRLSYVLPDGFTPLALPEPTRVEGPFGLFSLTWHRTEEGLRAEYDLRVADARVSPDQYRAFREFAASVDRAARGVVLVDRRKEDR